MTRATRNDTKMATSAGTRPKPGHVNTKEAEARPHASERDQDPPVLRGGFWRQKGQEPAGRGRSGGGRDGEGEPWPPRAAWARGSRADGQNQAFARFSCDCACPGAGRALQTKPCRAQTRARKRTTHKRACEPTHKRACEPTRARTRARTNARTHERAHKPNARTHTRTSEGIHSQRRAPSADPAVVRAGAVLLRPKRGGWRCF